MTESVFIELVNKWRKADLTQEELEIFRKELSGTHHQQLLMELLEGHFDSEDLEGLFPVSGQQEGLLKWKEIYQPKRITGTVHFLHTAWFRVAVVILLFSGVGAYLWQTNRSNPASIDEASAKVIQNNVMPGSDKAILTLSDGRRIILDSTAGKTIAEGKLQIQNNNNGLMYTASDVAVNNTMSTPNGGQYKLTLSDGTKVWLNAASSITYPTAFTKSTREVQITGEAYFEVAGIKEKPFIVSFNNTKIEVLGTSFNINAYENESINKATLIAGAVRVLHASGKVVLKPNEEAIISSTLFVNKNADVKQTLAWKNGVFNFKGQDFAASMRQIERWYDVKVVYDNGIPQQELWGSAYRSLTLADILKGLEGPVAHFRLEGRTLHVMP